MINIFEYPSKEDIKYFIDSFRKNQDIYHRSKVLPKTLKSLTPNSYLRAYIDHLRSTTIINSAGLLIVLEHIFTHNSLPRCKQCQGEFVVLHSKSLYCNPSCCAKGTLEQRKLTLKSKLGVEFSAQSDVCLEKRNNTLIKRYGSLESYHKQSRKKAQETCMSRYGVKHTYNSPLLKQKRDATMLCKYGTVHALQNPSLNQKMRNTRKLLDNEAIFKRIRETMLRKTGYEHAWMRNSPCRAKARKTNLERYGNEQPAKTKPVKDKAAETLIEKYGSIENFHKYVVVQGEKTNLVKIGARNSLCKNTPTRKRRDLTMLKKYNTLHSMQNPASFYKQARTAKAFKNIVVQGKVFTVRGYEDRAITVILDNCNIQATDLHASAEGNLSLFYRDRDDKRRVHYPDFWIAKQNLYVEVKSSWTYNLFKHKFQYILKAAKALERNYLLLVMTKEGLVDSYYYNSEERISSPSSKSFALI